MTDLSEPTPKTSIAKAGGIAEYPIVVYQIKRKHLAKEAAQQRPRQFGVTIFLFVTTPAKTKAMGCRCTQQRTNGVASLSRLN